MPRIYNSESDPLDFCKDCFPDEESAFEEHGGRETGPDDRGDCFGWLCEHPPYDEQFPPYRCHECNKELTERDD